MTEEVIVSHAGEIDNHSCRMKLADELPQLQFQDFGKHRATQVRLNELHDDGTGVTGKLNVAALFHGNNSPPTKDPSRTPCGTQSGIAYNVTECSDSGPHRPQFPQVVAARRRR